MQEQINYLPSKNIFLQHWVESLPQGRFIKKEDASRWYDLVMEIEPERSLWHFERLKGLGGSDVGEVANWKLNNPPYFKSVHQIVSEKLLKKSSLIVNNKAIRRGILFEPVLRKIFLEDYNGKSLNKLIDLINNNKEPLKETWLRGNVDDIVEIDNKVYIVDYKNSADIPNDIPLIYQAQVIQYDYILAQRLGKKISLNSDKPLACDGLLICYLDYSKGQAVVKEVKYNSNILKAMLEGGNELWHECILQGKYPKIEMPEIELELSEDERRSLMENKKKYVYYTLLLKEIENKKEEVKNNINSILTKGGLVDRDFIKQELGAEFRPIIRQNIKDKQIIDEIIKENNLDKDKIVKTTQKLDTKKVKEKIKSLGEKIKDYCVQEIDIDKLKQECEAKGVVLPSSILEQNIVFSVQLSDTPLIEETIKRKDKILEIVDNGIEDSFVSVMSLSNNEIENDIKEENNSKEDLEEDKIWDKVQALLG